MHHFTTLHYTTLHYTTPQYTAPQCTTLCFSTKLYTAVHYTALHQSIFIHSTVFGLPLFSPLISSFIILASSFPFQSAISQSLLLPSHSSLRIFTFKLKVWLLIALVMRSLLAPGTSELPPGIQQYFTLHYLVRTVHGPLFPHLVSSV